MLEGRVALVTGASRGIGRAIASELQKQGAKVVGTATTPEGAASIAAGGLTGKVLDVRDAARCDALIGEVQKELGDILILVNNAAVTRDNLALRMKDAEWDEVVDTNLKGTWLCSQLAAIPMMNQKYGRIVNTSSVAALGNIGQANYAASKAGVIGLTQTLALEWARFNIAVNCIAPGGVKTRMTAAIPENVLAGLLEKVPMKRLAEPSEIAAVHAFLASDMASYITGHVIFVDGGQTVGA